MIYLCFALLALESPYKVHIFFSKIIFLRGWSLYTDGYDLSATYVSLISDSFQRRKANRPESFMTLRPSHLPVETTVPSAVFYYWQSLGGFSHTYLTAELVTLWRDKIFSFWLDFRNAHGRRAWPLDILYLRMLHTIFGTDWGRWFLSTLSKRTLKTAMRKTEKRWAGGRL